MGTFGAARSLAPGNAVIAHDNLQATASSATVLLNPLTYSGSAAHVVLFHPGVTNYIIRARGIFTSRTTDPFVCVYRLYYRDGNVTPVGPGDTSVAADGTILHIREYAQDGTSTFFLPCTFAAVEGDSTYKYSPYALNSISGIGSDSAGTVQGFRFWKRNNEFGIIVLTSTAGNVAGSSDTLEAQVIAV